MKYICITADWNDADYICNLETISDATLELIKPVIKAIKENKGYNNWEDAHEKYVESKLVSEKALKTFAYLVPSGYEGAEVHTIESVEILDVARKTTLL